MTTPRRRRTWVDFIFNLSLADGAALQSQDILFDVAGKYDVKTVTRLIGKMVIYPDDLDAAVAGAMRVTAGIGVVAEEAHLGNTVPNPSVTTEFPALGWLYRQTDSIIKQNASGTMESWLYPTIQFDLGANRKVDRGVLFFTADATASDGTGFTVRLSGMIRALILT